MGQRPLRVLLLSAALPCVPAPAKPFAVQPQVEHRSAQCDVTKCPRVPKSWQVNNAKIQAIGYNVVTSVDIDYFFSLPVKAHAIGPFSSTKKLCTFAYRQHLDTSAGDLGFYEFTRQLSVGYGPAGGYGADDRTQFTGGVKGHLAKDKVPAGLYGSGPVSISNILDQPLSGAIVDPTCEWAYDPAGSAQLSGTLTVNYDHVTTLSLRKPFPGVPSPK